MIGNFKVGRKAPLSKRDTPSANRKMSTHNSTKKCKRRASSSVKDPY